MASSSGGGGKAALPSPTARAACHVSIPPGCHIAAAAAGAKPSPRNGSPIGESIPAVRFVAAAPAVAAAAMASPRRAKPHGLEA